MLTRIKQMHMKFKITHMNVAFTPKEKEFRICAMQEELDEYKEAKTAEEELDALVDLVVFAFGTAERQGWISIFEHAYHRVMNANMKKEIGTNTKRGSFKIDLVKPKGWKAPNHSDLIERLR